VQFLPGMDRGASGLDNNFDRVRVKELHRSKVQDDGSSLAATERSRQNSADGLIRGGIRLTSKLEQGGLVTDDYYVAQPAVTLVG
jgi:hypothetical protein